jgi:hypothetical protein
MIGYTCRMKKPRTNRPLWQRILLDIAGFGLIIISPLTGVLPGPGGIPVFLAGLGLVALNHEWAAHLLRDFERRREVFVDRFLMASPGVSLMIDIACLSVFAFGAYGALYFESVIARGLSIACITISLFVLLSNQKRLERIISKFKQR